MWASLCVSVCVCLTLCKTEAWCVFFKEGWRKPAGLPVGRASPEGFRGPSVWGGRTQRPVWKQERHFKLQRKRIERLEDYERQSRISRSWCVLSFAGSFCVGPQKLCVSHLLFLPQMMMSTMTMTSTGNARVLCLPSPEVRHVGSAVMWFFEKSA